MDLLLAPLQAATSKPARRAYLQTFLLLTSALFLLLLSASAYILFYSALIPRIGVTKPLHFLYPPVNTRHTAPPVATASFPASELAPQQTYTITLHLRLPTSPQNVDHGAFNVDLYVFAANHSQQQQLLHARRPGAMTWRSPLLGTMETLFRSPLLLTGLVRQEETLQIPLDEGAVFSAAPRSATVEIDPGITVYEGTLAFAARLKGVRWVMYHWWLTSFVVGTLGFWGVEVAAMLAVWWWVGGWLGEKGETEMETEELPETEQELRFEDTQRTFPTRGLGYPTPEPEEGEVGDDEESEVELLRDSGVGTESTGRERRGSAVRRRSRGAGSR